MNPEMKSSVVMRRGGGELGEKYPDPAVVEAYTQQGSSYTNIREDSLLDAGLHNVEQLRAALCVKVLTQTCRCGWVMATLHCSYSAPQQQDQHSQATACCCTGRNHLVTTHDFVLLI